MLEGTECGIREVDSISRASRHSVSKGIQFLCILFFCSSFSQCRVFSLNTSSFLQFHISYPFLIVTHGQYKKQELQ
jgi:hypothetical protein